MKTDYDGLHEQHPTSSGTAKCWSGKLMVKFCLKDMGCLDLESFKTYIAFRKQITSLTNEILLTTKISKLHCLSLLSDYYQIMISAHVE